MIRNHKLRFEETRQKNLEPSSFTSKTTEKICSIKDTSLNKTILTEESNIFKLLEKDPLNFFKLDQKQQKNPEVALKAIEIQENIISNSYFIGSYTHIFPRLSPELKNNSSFVKRAISIDPDIFIELPETLKNKKEIVMWAVSCDPRNLSDAEKFQDDVQVVLSTLNPKGSDSIRIFGLRDVIKRRAFGSGFEYASDRLKQDKRVILHAYEKCVEHLNKYPKIINDEICDRGINVILDYCNPNIWNDLFFVENILKISCRAIKHIPAPYKNNAKTILSYFYPLPDSKQLEFMKVYREIAIKETEGKKIDMFDWDKVCEVEDTCIVMRDNIHEEILDGFARRILKVMKLWVDQNPTMQKLANIHFKYK